jgi:hypothetical protein
VIRWRDARAALIALACTIGLVDGCPLPAEPYPWQRGVVEVVRPIREAALKPFAWIGRDLRIGQKWALFQSASSERFRLEVLGKTPTTDWQMLYRSGDSEPEAYADLLGYRRVRGVWNPTGNGPPGQYRDFVIWLSRRLFAEHPELAMVRVRMQKIHIDVGTVTDTNQYVFDFSRGRWQ